MKTTLHFLIIFVFLTPFTAFADERAGCWEVVWNRKPYCITNDPVKRSQKQMKHDRTVRTELEDLRVLGNEYSERNEELKDQIEELNRQRKPMVSFCEDETCLMKARQNKAYNEIVDQKVKQIEHEGKRNKEQWAELPSRRALEKSLERMNDLYDIAANSQTRDKLAPLYQERYRLEDLIYIDYANRDRELQTLKRQLDESKRPSYMTCPSKACEATAHANKEYNKGVRKRMEEVEAQRRSLWKEKGRIQKQLDAVRQKIRDAR